MVQQTLQGVLHDLELNSIASVLRKLHMFLGDEDPRFHVLWIVHLGFYRSLWLGAAVLAVDNLFLQFWLVSSNW